MIELNHRLLSHEEEIALAERIQAGGEDGKAALDELVSHNLRLVQKFTETYFADDPATQEDDFFQAGVLGLIEAAQRFDPTLGNRFSTFAVWHVRKGMQRMAMTAGTIRKSANPNWEHRRESSARAHALRQQSVARLDAPLGDGDDRTLLDVVAAADVEDTETVALNRVEVERLIALGGLTERQEAVIRAWMDGYSNVDAGALFGLSRSYLHTTLKDFKERIERQIGKVEGMEFKTCSVEGCNEPRKVGTNGAVMSRCEEHQRAYWRDVAAGRRKERSEAGRSGNGHSRNGRGGHDDRVLAGLVPASIVEADERDDHADSDDLLSENIALHNQVSILTVQVEKLRGVILKLLKRHVDEEVAAALDALLE